MTKYLIILKFKVKKIVFLDVVNWFGVDLIINTKNQEK